MVFVMLNPSTADGNIDDPTIRRCITFAKDWGYGALVVVNLYAQRATDPSELFEDEDFMIRGLSNEKHVLKECQGRDVIFAWGASRRPDPEGDLDLALDIKRDARSVMCLGKTLHGHPRHPLMLRKDTKRERWTL